ncbi:MAG TPA: MFS transporter [Candidatus Paceibacterota bacterium]|nr:MFS transporter [Candidatus Paceibacterota bacterium]
MIDTIAEFGHRTFASLKIRNYRLYFIGQAISQSGTWMQIVALGWLVLELTGSGSQLGLVVASQFWPILMLGPWGGVIVDRFNKRAILFWTNAVFFALATGISILVFTDTIQLWMLYAFSFSYGMVRVLDNPARQTFVSEMVNEGYLKNAVSLNATVNHLMRAVGPSIAGVLIAGIGIAFCFLINGLSYLAVIAMLYLMRKGELHTKSPVLKKAGQLAEGFRYVLATPIIKKTLIMMAIIGTFAYEFQVSLPLLAQQTFMGDAASYAALLAAMGIGSALGGLYSAGRHKIAHHHLVIFAMLFGGSMVLTSIMPTLHLAVLGMFFVGIFSINVISLGNTTVQLESIPEMRGRVMALWSVAMVGSTALGGPIIGFIGEHVGARWGLAVGGIITIMTVAFLTYALLQRDTLQEIPEGVEDKVD